LLCLIRKCAIARFVRQTRTMTYEKSEKLSGVAVAPEQFFTRRLRQTRTESVRCRGVQKATANVAKITKRRREDENDRFIVFPSRLPSRPVAPFAVTLLRLEAVDAR
jgi:hypothetical protein